LPMPKPPVLEPPTPVKPPWAVLEPDEEPLLLLPVRMLGSLTAVHAATATPPSTTSAINKKYLKLCRCMVLRM